MFDTQFNVKNHIHEETYHDYELLIQMIDKLERLPDGLKLKLKAKHHLTNLLEHVIPKYR